MSRSIEAKTTGTPVAGANRMARAIIVVVLLGAVLGFVYWGSTPGGNLLTHNLSQPLNGATTAKVDIDAGSGNLAINRLTGGEQVLVSGTLQYLDNQGVPTLSVTANNGQANLALRGGQATQRWFSFPWAACNGATDWQVQVNPNVHSDITAHTDGGNVNLNLAGMAVTRVVADTGGGNVDVALPDSASGLNVKAGTGAGNVVVRVPSGMAAKVHATSGLGKVIVDSRFSKIDGNTYQSSDYDSATNRAEITVNSGAGNVSVETK